MALKKVVAPGTIYESATDPTGDSAITVTAKFLWLDTSTNPAVLKERNSANTGWNTLGGSGGANGTITVTISTGADTWTGTKSDANVTSTSKITMGINLNSIDATILPSITSQGSGTFDWKAEAFQWLTSGTFYIHYTVG